MTQIHDDIKINSRPSKKKIQQNEEKNTTANK